MLLRKGTLNGCKTIGRRRIHGPIIRNEYSEKAREFPALEKYQSENERELLQLKNRINSLNTVEEKNYYFNLPKQFGWYSLLLNDQRVRYNSLPFLQYATQTKILRESENLSFPSIYPDLNDDSLNALAVQLNKPLSRLIIDHFKGKRQNFYDVENDFVSWHDRFAMRKGNIFLRLNDFTRDFVVNLDRILSLSVSPESRTNAQVDQDARVEGFWFAGGIQPDRSMLRKRLGARKSNKKHGVHSKYNDPDRPQDESSEDPVHEKYDRAVQYKGKHLLQVRNKGLLPQFVDLNDEIVTSGSIPVFDLDPRTLGYKFNHVHGVNIPGVWTTSDYKFASLNYISPVNREEKLTTISSDLTTDEAFEIKALQAAFASCLGSATYLGFGPFTDPTYPITTQNVVTDGKRFKLSAYQCNKTDMTTNKKMENDVGIKNLMWTSNTDELFQFNETSSQVEINDDLLKRLISFYALTPERINLETPFLHPQVKYLHQIKNLYNREYFTIQYMKLCRGITADTENRRPRIQSWEKRGMMDTKDFDDFGLRERNWFKMAKISHYGKEHWHPEFVKLDYYRPPYKNKKLRLLSDNVKDRYYKKVTVPVPLDEENEK